ncbi:MAG: hypothetical protein KatS3mg042_0676 [Rhodothermaceae bacterium]|nr:MAG: hypothetical protein KatS3mg042_0676 [Rhodothermaceae bacterium]
MPLRRHGHDHQVLRLVVYLFLLNRRRVLIVWAPKSAPCLS